MKIRTRIATAASIAIATVLVSAPAFASEGVEKVDTHAPFSSAGQPVDIIAISIVGVVLLGIVLLSSTLLGNLFEKGKKQA